MKIIPRLEFEPASAAVMFKSSHGKVAEPPFRDGIRVSGHGAPPLVGRLNWQLQRSGVQGQLKVSRHPCEATARHRLAGKGDSRRSKAAALPCDLSSRSKAHGAVRIVRALLCKQRRFRVGRGRISRASFDERSINVTALSNSHRSVAGRGPMDGAAGPRLKPCHGSNHRECPLVGCELPCLL